MAIRMIVKHPDPVLREKCAPVKKFTPNIHKLLDDMKETMYDAEGVGLAAPQVGITKRVVVIDAGDGLVEMINPEILERRDEQFGPEGCLSIPGLVGDVRRAKWVKAKALDRNGKEFVIEGEDLLARAIQHEIDHLNGVLFIDLAERTYSGKDE
ncbi:peptide deformylase [Aneurinibacillus terranovensis]|uniref:peptide deformylase n=1 Tax=Aneurinibacillus terranovensis TaxID=278991 RepID=UPI000425897C|nr:peptide deformylase [Aneurinibacillus terranovensis]